ncbi:MAG: FadR family transcriptional regulator [Desulfomonile tiedjei]|nr:FadR family transcriptional regulator [Desulfomonile tiedjei]
MTPTMFEAAAKPEKVSERIVEQIRDAVLSGRLKPGDRVASEKELVVQFGVSKATMREALRVLEAMGLVEIRKGIQGGVFIAEVDMTTTIHSIMNFLHFKAVSIHDITMLRFVLEPQVAHMAAARVTAEDIPRLKQMIEQGEDSEVEISKDIGFHRYLARLSDNPILILIMDFIDNLLRDVKSRLNLTTGFYNEIKECHSRILDCLVRGDAVAARREIIHDILSVGDFMADVMGTVRFDPAVLGFDRNGLPLGFTGAWAGSPVGPGLNRDATDAALLAQGMLFRQVGSGDLYLLVPPKLEREQRDREDSGSEKQPGGPAVSTE